MKVNHHDSEEPSNQRLLLEYISEAVARSEEKASLRLKNQAAIYSRPDEKELRNLDSSLKRNTAFVRKLKTFSASQAESLLREMSSLNLSKYMSEIASALVETKLKMTDVPAAVSVCCSLHRMYSEFSGLLFEYFQKSLVLKKDEQICNPSKLRVDICFFSDLINVGLFPYKEAMSLLGCVLTSLIQGDREEHKNVYIILTFCKHCGADFAALVPRRIRQLSEEYEISLPKSDFLNADKVKNLRVLLKEYYASLCRHLIKEYNELQNFETQNKRILQTKGELNSLRRDWLINLQSSYEKLLSNTISFADIIDEDLPVLTNLELPSRNDGFIANPGDEDEDFPEGTSIWEDDGHRNFYENIPNLASIVPGFDTKSITAETEITVGNSDMETKKGNDVKCIPAEEMPKNSGYQVFNVMEKPSIPIIGNEKVAMDSFLLHLVNCITIEKIDSAAIEFALNLNTQYNRRKLAKALFSVPRNRLDLLPYYARMVAILNPCMPDVASKLNSMLLQEFSYHLKKKDQINIESKVKVVRFIGELVNFGVFPKGESLQCLKALMQIFTHHFIEMTCNLLETCGVSLYRGSVSHRQTKIYLEQMMRKKAVSTFDSRYVTMIENAYYHIIPPETKVNHKKKTKSTMLLYIDMMLHKQLSKDTTNRILCQMRKLDWNDTAIFSYLIKCFTHIWKFKYYSIGPLADLVSGIAVYQEEIGIQIVDAVLEDIRMCMEIGLPRLNQRRIAMVKYLGELYNYRLLGSSDIFKTLYLLTTLGVPTAREASSSLDPPDNLFRIRLVCILLETCGAYFSHGSSKEKLDYFLVYFQNYFWLKKSHPYWNSTNPFPIGVTIMFDDTLTSLRPNIKMYRSYEESNAEVEKIECDLLSKFPEILSSSEDNPVHDALLSDRAKNCPSEEWNENKGENWKTKAFPSPVEDSSQLRSSDLTPIASNFLRERSLAEGKRSSFADERCVTNFPPKLTKCSENDEFMAEFDKTLMEDMQERALESGKPKQVDMPIPFHKKESSKKSYDQLLKGQENNPMASFVLMVRKGSKQLYKKLEMPLNSELVINLKNREEAEKEERDRVKRLTLNINERFEEEEYADANG